MISKLIFILFGLAKLSLAQLVPAPTIIVKPSIIAPIAPSPTIIVRPTIISPPTIVIEPTIVVQPSIISPPSIDVPPSIISPPSIIVQPSIIPPPTTRPPFSRPPTIVPELRNSHLTCFRGNVAVKGRFNATIALKANDWQPQYSVNKCKLNVKKVEFCVPSTKIILQTNTTFPTVLQQYPPQELENDFLCYLMKCDETTTVPDSVVVADQFGIKATKIVKDKVMKVCTPAWKLDKSGRPIIITG